MANPMPSLIKLSPTKSKTLRVWSITLSAVWAALNVESMSPSKSLLVQTTMRASLPAVRRNKETPIMRNPTDKEYGVLWDETVDHGTSLLSWPEETRPPVDNKPHQPGPAKSRLVGKLQRE